MAPGGIAGASPKCSYMFGKQGWVHLNSQSFAFMVFQNVLRDKGSVINYGWYLKIQRIGLIFWDRLYQWSRYSAREVLSWFPTGIDS